MQMTEKPDQNRAGVDVTDAKKALERISQGTVDLWMNEIQCQEAALVAKQALSTFKSPTDFGRE